MTNTILRNVLLCINLGVVCGHAAESDVRFSKGLIGHWRLQGDLQDQSGNNRHAIEHGSVERNIVGRNGSAQSAIRLDGRQAWLEIPSPNAPQPGRNDFSLSVWLNVAESLDVPATILSQYDPESRRGFHLTLKTNSVTTTLANWRELQFGIDDNRSADWMDCGRPGNALLGFSLAVHNRELYVGTCEPGVKESGHVYRFAGGDRWLDCGAPDASNSVTSLAVYRGQLFAATGKYRVAGSALPESENTQLGGRVFRYAGEKTWHDCGQLPQTEAVGGMVVFRGRLYASSLYRPAGFYRYEGESRWADCGSPDGKRVVALGVFEDHLYATSYDGGHVYRYDGSNWIDCGQLGDNTQTYSFAVYEGRLYVGTWPSGKVYRFEEVNRWTDVGRLGEELEVMGMLVHNGRLLAGTLPLAEIYGFERDGLWKKLTRLDHTPDVRYRRAWTMAEHDGKVFCSTLPSGKIFSFEAGRSVFSGSEFPAGWHYVAAVKATDYLALYLDGRELARTRGDVQNYDLNNSAPLRIGFGPNGYFRGDMSDLRMYGRALPEDEIRELSKLP